MTAIPIASAYTSTYPVSFDRRAEWASVATRTVYFAHQSVGNDVLSGVEALSEELELRLRLLRSRELGSISGPAIVHFLAGQNCDFASKNEALLRFLEHSRRAANPIVLLKYCYVDINALSDVAGIFDEYLDTVATIELAHPDAVVVHSTVPLTSRVEPRMKARAKTFLGRRSLRDDAAARHRYNTLVRNEFANRTPLFDVARSESTHRDGTSCGFVQDGELIETLCPEYTEDGGHLNAIGQRHVAAAFLDTVSEASRSAPAIARAMQ